MALTQQQQAINHANDYLNQRLTNNSTGNNNNHLRSILETPDMAMGQRLSTYLNDYANINVLYRNINSSLGASWTWNSIISDNDLNNNVYNFICCLRRIITSYRGPLDDDANYDNLVTYLNFFNRVQSSNDLSINWAGDNDKLSNFNNIISTIHDNSTGNTVLPSLTTNNQLNFDDINDRCSDLKIQLAEIIGSGYSNTNTVQLSNAERAEIENRIDSWLNSLNIQFNQNETLSETDILRDSAVKNLNITLSSPEVATLNKISQQVSNKLRGSQYEHSFGRIEGNYAQRIQKIKDAIQLLVNNNQTTDGIDIADFEKLEEKLNKPLGELDKAHYELDLAKEIYLDAVGEHGDRYLGLKVEKGTISSDKIGQLAGVLKGLGNQTLEGHLDELYKKLGTTQNVKILHDQFEILARNSNFAKVLKDNKLNRDKFARYYFSYFSIEILAKARRGYFDKKQEVFKDNTANFNADVNNFRIVQRNKILHLAQDINANIDQLNNIFDKNSKAFYTIDGDNANNTRIMNALERVLIYRYRNDNRIVISNNFLTPLGTDLYQHILSRNTADNELFNGNINTDKERSFLSKSGNWLKKKGKEFIVGGDTNAYGMGRFGAGALNLAGSLYGGINKHIVFPGLKNLVGLSEWTVKTVVGKGALGLTGWTSKKIEKALSWTTKPPETFWGAFAKGPLLLAFPVTKTMELLFRGGNKLGGAVANKYVKANNAINAKASQWSKGEVNSLAQFVIASGLSKGVLGLGLLGGHDSWVNLNKWSAGIVKKIDEKEQHKEKYGDNKGQKELIVDDFIKNLGGSPKAIQTLNGLDIAQKFVPNPKVFTGTSSVYMQADSSIGNADQRENTIKNGFGEIIKAIETLEIRINALDNFENYKDNVKTQFNELKKCFESQSNIDEAWVNKLETGFNTLFSILNRYYTRCNLQITTLDLEIATLNSRIHGGGTANQIDSWTEQVRDKNKERENNRRVRDSASDFYLLGTLGSVGKSMLSENLPAIPGSIPFRNIQISQVLNGIRGNINDSDNIRIQLTNLQHIFNYINGFIS